jgi:hypothetical protein
MLFGILGKPLASVTVSRFSQLSNNEVAVIFVVFNVAFVKLLHLPKLLSPFILQLSGTNTSVIGVL